MQKGKRIFHVLATLLAILPIASCRMDSGDIKTASQEEGQHTENTIIIRTNVSAEEYMATNARSAVPSQFLDTDRKQLVFAGALYASTSQEEDKIFQKGEYNKNSVTLAFESANEERKDYTLEIRAYKGETESFDGTPLLCGTTTITIAANNREINAPAIKLKPFESATEKGNINLEILIPSDYTLSIEAEGGGNDFSPTIKCNNPENEYTKCTISASGIKAGIYEVDFLLWNSDRTNVVYLWNEAINIYPGMTTDKWNTGSVKDGARQIDKARIFSTFYVKGENPQSKWFQTLDSSTEENGSLSHPYTKIQDAIDRVVSINDGSTPFSIYIDGTLTQDEVPSGEGMANFSALNKNLTLTIKSLSDEKATLDAGGKSRVINAKPASSGTLNLTLEKLVIKSGNAADTNNGGGSFVYGGTFTLEDCEITDNNAQKGGGLYVEQTTLLMKDTTISGSTATDEGGGVYVNDGTLTINGGTFSKNTAQQGGGVYVTDSNSIFTMAGGEISNNRAYSAGGGIYVKESKQATISGTTISVNTANVDGGGVFVSDGAMLTVNGTITGNIAQQGGGVYIRGGTLTMSDTATINGNKASGDGGGVYVASNASTFTMTGGTLSENEAGSSGGAFYVYDGKFIMDDGTISENTANVNGGGIYVTDGATVTMSGGTIGGNKASQDGGGVYITGNASTFTMNDGKIGDENIANIAQNGGGVYVKDNSTFTMSGGEIIGNTAKQDGGGVYSNNGKFIMSDGKISDENTAQNGGGVYVADSSTFTMTAGEISNNKAIWGGGAYFKGKGTFTMTGGEISNNKTIKGNVSGVDVEHTGQGGGVYLYDAEFKISGAAKIRKNTADTSGGGIFIYKVLDPNITDATLTMTGGEISGNVATDNGGGVYNQNGTLTMSGGTIGGDTISDKNTAKRGGGVNIDNGEFEMKSSTAKISNNEAIVYGGGVYVNGAGSMFTMENGTLSVNKANDGGGVYIDRGKFEMKGGTIIGNSAATKGKGAYCSMLATMFKMSGDANFDKNNDVFIGISKKITIGGTLNKNYVATITPSNYDDNVEILSVDASVTMDETLCNKLFSITPNNGTKWKISYDSSSRKGVLKKDDVSTKGGISVTLSGQGTYTFKVVAGSTEITEDSNLQSGTITLSEVKKDGTSLPANDGTFTIEIRDESGNPYPFSTASATGLPGTVTVPTVPVEQKAQVYVKVQLNDDSIIEKTIPVTIQP